MAGKVKDTVKGKMKGKDTVLFHIFSLYSSVISLTFSIVEREIKKTRKIKFTTSKPTYSKCYQLFLPNMPHTYLLLPALLPLPLFLPYLRIAVASWLPFLLLPFSYFSEQPLKWFLKTQPEHIIPLLKKLSNASSLA